jgi:hypothetical protein
MPTLVDTSFRRITASLPSLLPALAFAASAALVGVDARAAVDVTFTPLVAMRAVADGVFVHEGAAIGVARNGLSLRAFESECRTHGDFYVIDDERSLCVIQQQGKNGPVWLVSATRIIPGDTDTLTVTMSTSAGDEERAALVGGVARALLDRCFLYTTSAEEAGRLVIGAPVEDCVAQTSTTTADIPAPRAPVPSSPDANSGAAELIVDKFHKSKGPLPSARMGLQNAKR